MHAGEAVLRRRRGRRDAQDGRPGAGRPVRRRAAPERGVGGQALRPILPRPQAADEQGMFIHSQVWLLAIKIIYTI